MSLLGVDWEGPTTIQDDNGTVHIRELPEYLSHVEIQTHSQHLTVSSETIWFIHILLQSTMCIMFLVWSCMLYICFHEEKGL